MNFRNSADLWPFIFQWRARAEIHKMAAELAGSAVGARPKTAAATGLGSQAGGIKIERLL